LQGGSESASAAGDGRQDGEGSQEFEPGIVVMAREAREREAPAKVKPPVRGVNFCRVPICFPFFSRHAGPRQQNEYIHIAAGQCGCILLQGG